MKYEYTEEEYKIALERVKKEYEQKGTNNERPKLVFAAGQPASGKSALPQKIIEDNTDIHFVVIDMDMYRMYHPRIQKIGESNDDFVQATNAFSIRMEKDMLEHCLTNRDSFIHVGTMRIYEYLKEVVIDRAIEQGYEIEVYALAVPNIESKLSAISREDEQRKRRSKFVRKTSPSFIDEADTGFKRSVEIMSDSPDISNLKILIRGKDANSLPIIVYNQNTDKGKKYQNGYEALIATRKKQMNKNEIISEMEELAGNKKKECDEQRGKDEIYR